MEKILILGAGAAQVPLIRTAKAMGLETVVATIPGPYPGLAEADIVSYTDITDAQAITQAARQYAVSGIATCCFETGLKALAYACEQLGLPGISQEAAEISVNKLAMKRAFQVGGVLSAKYKLLQQEGDLSAAMDEIGFPMVIKAVDLQGSSGVTVVYDEAQARQALAQALALTHKDYCIAEAFITGDNIGAEAFVQNGRVLFVLPDGTISHHGSVNIPIGHYAPLDRPEAVLRGICENVEKAISACGLDNCAVNVDLVLHGDEPYIIELTARAGATCLPELVSIYYGIDYYKMILMAALGQDVRPLFDTRRQEPCPNASTMISAPQAGVIRSIQLPDGLPENVYDLHLIVKEGDHVCRFSGCRDRIGQIIVSGNSVPGCLRDIEAILSQIKIEVE
jgi:biotin carboxylase